MRRFLARFGLLLLLVYLVLFGLPFGPDPLAKAISQVGITLVLGIWLIRLWRSGRDFPRTVLDGPFLALGIAWAIAALASPDPRRSLEQFWVYFIEIVLFYFFVDLTRRGRLRWLMEGLLFAVVFNVILAVTNLILWYINLPKSGLEEWPQILGFPIPTRPPPLTNLNPNPEAAFMAIFIPVVWAWSNTTSQRDLRWTLRALSGIFVTVLVFTQSRGGFMALAAILGLELVRWLLQPETRDRFPAVLRPLLAPRVLIAGTCIAGFMAVLLVLGFFTDANDIARLDLWYSAIEIFRHHLLSGVGPNLFPIARYQYAIWDRSVYMDHPHAHNLVFHLLAEGGLIVFTSVMWLIVRLGKTWVQQYRQANSTRKRRLEGVLIAILAFGVQNMVDVFTQLQFIAVLAIWTAYIVAPIQQPSNRRTGRRSFATPLLLSMLLIAQVAFIPVHRGGLAQRRAVLALDAEDPEKALEAIRAAQASDPWLDLYEVQEAYILGVLAYQNPEQYLTPAITAHEEATALVPMWPVVWHNLAALYNQAGRSWDAVSAEEEALARDSFSAPFWLQLGVYHEALGESDRAQDAYFEALQRDPMIANSGFWSNPQYPERADLLALAVQHFKDDPALAFDLAVYSGDFETARDLSRTVPSQAIRDRAEALWPTDSSIPCVRCYYIRKDPLLLQAEEMLYQDADPIAREAALEVIFSNGNQRAWYVLARVADAEGESEETIEAWLRRSVPQGAGYHPPKITAVYNVTHKLDVLPQARIPTLNEMDYVPWLDLAARLEVDHRWDEAEALYQDILQHDPYAWDIQQHVQHLSTEKQLSTDPLD